MLTDVDGPELLVDTSVAVPLLVSDHQHHAQVFSILADRRLGPSGHVAFETHSVLTRLPVPARRAPSAVHWLFESNLPHTRFLSAERSVSLFIQLASEGLAGGSVYDGLAALPRRHPQRRGHRRLQPLPRPWLARVPAASHLDFTHLTGRIPRELT